MTRLSRRFARLPLRVRLVAGFSATMFLVLAAAGAFVYWRVDYALDRQINDELVDVSRVLAPLVTRELRLCYGGRHERFGRSFSVPCEQSGAMTLTVLLPTPGDA